MLRDSSPDVKIGRESLSLEKREEKEVKKDSTGVHEEQIQTWGDEGLRWFLLLDRRFLSLFFTIDECENEVYVQLESENDL